MLSDWEVGDCVLTRHDDGRVHVTRADQIVHLSVELLKRTDLSAVVDGDLVTVGDINPVTYRITERNARVVEAVRVD